MLCKRTKIVEDLTKYTGCLGAYRSEIVEDLAKNTNHLSA